MHIGGSHARWPAGHGRRGVCKRTATLKLRTLLFAPGDSERKAAKAIASDADCVILDLEDSVAPGAKAAARAAVAAMLPLQRPAAVRINQRGSPWYLADLASVVPHRPHAIMLPTGSPASCASIPGSLPHLKLASRILASI